MGHNSSTIKTIKNQAELLDRVMTNKDVPLQINAKTYPQCLIIIEKVSFKIASEASYVYFLNGQKCQKLTILVSF